MFHAHQPVPIAKLDRRLGTMVLKDSFLHELGSSRDAVLAQMDRE